LVYLGSKRYTFPIADMPPTYLQRLIHMAYIALRESIKGNWKKMPAFFRGIKNGFQSPLGEFPSAEESVIDHA